MYQQTGKKQGGGALGRRFILHHGKPTNSRRLAVVCSCQGFAGGKGRHKMQDAWRDQETMVQHTRLLDRPVGLVQLAHPHTHTQTHTKRERERERQREMTR